MEQEIIEIGEPVTYKDRPMLEGRVLGIQLSLPGCTPNYFIKWKFCRSVSGPVSGRMIEKKRPDAYGAPGLGGVMAV